MIRVIGFALLIPFAIYLVWPDAPALVLQAAFLGSLGVVLFALWTNRAALRCPHCGKRVKLGYSTCHHCGHQVAGGHG